MSSAVGGGCWLLIGGGVAATGCFFAAQPARRRQHTSQALLMAYILPRHGPACPYQSWLHALKGPAYAVQSRSYLSVTLVHGSRGLPFRAASRRHAFCWRSHEPGP